MDKILLGVVFLPLSLALGMFGVGLFIAACRFVGKMWRDEDYGAD